MQRKQTRGEADDEDIPMDVWTFNGEQEFQLADFCGNTKAFPGVPVGKSRVGPKFRTWAECEADITLLPW